MVRNCATVSDCPHVRPSLLDRICCSVTVRPYLLVRICSTVSVGPHVRPYLLVRICSTVSVGPELFDRICWSACSTVSVGPYLLDRICWSVSVQPYLLGDRQVITLNFLNNVGCERHQDRRYSGIMD
jgi:hypothetical protein